MEQETEQRRGEGAAVGSPPDSGSLTRRVASGIGWMFLGQAFTWGCTLGKLIAVAAVLDPEAFGLFGLVLLTTRALRTFSQTGFHAAMIQRRDLTDAHLDTAWTALALRGLLLTGLLLAVAPLIGWFFREPDVVPLLRTMSLVLAMQGVTNIGVVYFPRELHFKKEFTYRLVPALVNATVGVGLALLLRSVWALVFASLAVNLTQVALSYILHPYRPRLSLDIDRVRQLFSFGKWVLATTALGFIAMNADDAFLGRVLGVAALGVYQLAYKLSSFGAVELGKVITRVLFPGYALMQNDRARVRRAYLRVLSAIILIMGPITAGVAAVAPVFVHVILGPRWRGAIVPLQILCIFGFLRSFRPVTGSLFLGIGQPKWQTKALVVQVAVMAVLIWPATDLLGIEGTCITVVLALLMCNLYGVVKTCTILDIGGTTLARYVTGAAIPAALMFLTVTAVRPRVPRSVPGFVILVASGILTYGFLCLLLCLAALRTRSSTTVLAPFQDSIDVLKRILRSRTGE